MTAHASRFWAAGWWTAPIHPLWLLAALALTVTAAAAAGVVRRRRARRRLHEHWAQTTAALAVRPPRQHDLSLWAVVLITVAVSAPVSAVIGAVVALIAVTAAGAGRADDRARAARTAGLTRDVRDALDLARPASTTTHDQTEQRGQQR